MKFWDFFENLNEYVYVTDMEEYTLVYMNKKLREMCGVSSAEDYVGKKCYEMLQRCSSPCTICTNKELKPGHFCEWWYYNPVFNKNLSIKDSMIEEDGRKYRIEIAIDISPQEWRANVVQDYENLEALANEALRIALRKESPDESIDVFLEYLGKTMGGDRTYVFEKNEKGNDDNTYEWVAAGVRPERENLQNLPPEVCARWYSQFGENKHVEIKDLEEIREIDPVQYEVLKRQDIHSLFVMPLYDNKKVIGFYGVDNPSGKYIGHVSDILEMVAHYIVAALRRRELLKRLKKEETDRAEAAARKEITETLFGAQMGVWQLIVGEGEPKLFTDSTVAELIGIPENVPPGEAYQLWYANIDDAYKEEMLGCVEEAVSGKNVEKQYVYHHPQNGFMTIRCGGGIRYKIQRAG